MVADDTSDLSVYLIFKYLNRPLFIFCFLYFTRCVEKAIKPVVRQNSAHCDLRAKQSFVFQWKEGTEACYCIDPTAELQYGETVPDRTQVTQDCIHWKQH